MDRAAYEKLSICDSARSLKKYGSTSSKHVTTSTRTDNYQKHYISNTDTLQGIALRYDVTIEQIRRVNRLWASDSLFLREFLLIPVAGAPSSDTSSSCVTSPTDSIPVSSSPASQVSSPDGTYGSSSTAADGGGGSGDGDDNDNISDFLGKIDASIASTKADVRKAQKHSVFAAPNHAELGTDRRKPAVSRLKQMVNNNGSSYDLYPAMQQQQQQQHTVVVVAPPPHNKRAQSSLQLHEQQQDELFEL